MAGEDFQEFARVALGRMGIEVDEVDLAVMSVAEAVYGPEREALLAADLSDVRLRARPRPVQGADRRRAARRMSATPSTRRTCRCASRPARSPRASSTRRSCSTRR